MSVLGATAGAWLMTAALVGVADAMNAEPLDGTEPFIVGEADMAVEMVAGIDRFLMREIDASIEARRQHWRRDFASHEAYTESVNANRERLKTIIGAVDPRVATSMNLDATVARDAVVGRGPGYTVYAVAWPVFDGVFGEGLLVEPEVPPAASVIALPDCDWTPEMVVGLAEGLPPPAHYARMLGQAGLRVVVPVLVNRDDTFSGNPSVRMTNQPHREFVYRAAFEMGRHIIGFEVQKVLAAVDWLKSRDDTPVAVMGYGEGGLIAFHAAAVDTRIDAAVVSGYFGPRERVWAEPIYRNVWALLEQFGDAEIASLIAPRPLIIEAARHPDVGGPPAPRDGRAGAAPGAIVTPDIEFVRREVTRAAALVDGLNPAPVLRLVDPKDGVPGAAETLDALLECLGVPAAVDGAVEPPKACREDFGADARMRRQFTQLMEHIERLMDGALNQRAAFWSKADAASVESWQASTEWYRDYFWDEVIGRLPEPSLPPNARTRLVFDQPEYRGYEVVLDVYPDVIAYGLLLVPKGMGEGERRPVVVCQHGLEGRPQKVASPEEFHEAYAGYGCTLAKQGYVVFAPQNPYYGGDAFRVLQRKANPLKKSLFSVIVRQHQRILEWLGTLGFVDPARIAFYGLSYGGKTALRVPALLDGYCLSICSGDFNEWIWKNVSIDYPNGYMFSGEYEMPEFDLGNTFNHAEMTWLICPRPFMVERGHFDLCAPDEWVGYEYARTQRRYDLLGLGDRVDLEVFNGPHAIHGVGTFAFLDRFLRGAPTPE
ncbi:MAG TPA: dienelactone hydrolase family protein [Candidatus Hydrogenedentes bacterium]|nr:dienelactone hydrolase family protein [Candidatus Hydrogenedentota bacterium]HPG65446.1 dienelactone hydrolase family protein [Candidatus Hydrogenedentota bacterium]